MNRKVAIAAGVAASASAAVASTAVLLSKPVQESPRDFDARGDVHADPWQPSVMEGRAYWPDRLTLLARRLPVGGRIHRRWTGVMGSTTTTQEIVSFLGYRSDVRVSTTDFPDGSRSYEKSVDRRVGPRWAAKPKGGQGHHFIYPRGNGGLQ